MESYKELKQELLDITEQCVRCGMCMPHCPTNKLTNLEGDGPRGRIALWQNLANNKLSLTKKTSQYLNSCLSCGACANNCPAGVDFLKLQDLGKSLILSKQFNQHTPKQPWLNKLIVNRIITILSSKTLTFIMHSIMYAYQKMKLHYFTVGLLKFLPRLRAPVDNIYNILPKLKIPRYYISSINAHYELNNDSEYTEVLLFTGCVNKLTSQNSINAAIRLLYKLNIKVNLSSKLHCCGALYQHNGCLDKSTKLINKNRHSLNTVLSNNPRISNILTFDTGCHPAINGQFQRLKTKKQITVTSIESFVLEQINVRNGARKISNSQNIYIYLPCSQKEQTKTPDLTRKLLLSVFPEHVIKILPSGYGCCGAAGSYMLDQQPLALKLARNVIEQSLEQYPDLKSKQPALICTSNIGCKLHLTNVLRNKYNIDAIIKSPIEIIYEHID